MNTKHHFDFSADATSAAGKLTIRSGVDSIDLLTSNTLSANQSLLETLFGAGNVQLTGDWQTGTGHGLTIEFIGDLADGNIPLVVWETTIGQPSFTVDGPVTRYLWFYQKSIEDVTVDGGTFTVDGVEYNWDDDWPVSSKDGWLPSVLNAPWRGHVTFAFLTASPDDPSTNPDVNLDGLTVGGQSIEDAGGTVIEYTPTLDASSPVLCASFDFQNAVSGSGLITDADGNQQTIRSDGIVDMQDDVYSVVQLPSFYETCVEANASAHKRIAFVWLVTDDSMRECLAGLSLARGTLVGPIDVTASVSQEGAAGSPALTSDEHDALMRLATDYTTSRAAQLDHLDADISSRLAGAAYIAPNNSAITAIKAKTDNLPSEPAAVGSAMTLSDKSGFKLASDGLDSVSVTPSAGAASNFREMMVQVWRRFFAKATKSSAQLITYADDGTTVVTTQSVSDDGILEIQGPAT
ncbi:MAG TPA: hypothetical protein VHV77_07385 [Pirellulales bacterium]|jgi:hypothetical protein|nr:hypothetical protein [Pirellulales bacterium]